VALTKELVSLHHGDIFVESEVGVGTTFTVRLPLGKAHFLEEELVQIPEPNEKLPVDSGELTKIDYLYQPPVESAPADMTPAEKFEKNLDLYSEIVDDEPLILIIEDNADLRLYVSLSLQKQFHVHEAEDGQKGLQKAYELIPDLVITDIMMPDMDGYDLCAQLKKDERTAHVPIIMLTALNSDESRIKGIEAGADDYITKPFNTDILNARIDNLVQSRKKLKEQFDQGIILGKDKPEIAALSSDKFFMEKVIELIEGHMNDPDFSVEDFSSELGLSRAQLYRKIKAITGRTISEFVRAMRLRYSAQLLKEGRLHINEIMYRVGFSSQSYFTKCFRQQYGISPKEYANQDKDS
ncbi:MAG: response regulator, partial [Bacteroidota bacterium]